MPIPNYVRPQVEIYQQLDYTLAEVGTQMTACIIGPNYNLYRYGKEELSPHAFTTKKQFIPYTFIQSEGYEYEIDLNSVRLFAEGLMAKVATFSQKLTVDPLDQTIIRLPEGEVFMSATGDDMATELSGYHVQAGDCVKVKAKADDETYRTCKIVDIVGKRIPAKVTAEKVQVVNDAGVTFELASGESDYTGTKDTTYILTVGKESMVTVTDSSGVDTALSFKASEGEETSIGTLGVKIKITGVDQLTEGDILTVVCLAASESTVEFDGLQLERIPFVVSEEDPTTLEEVLLLHPFDGEVCRSNGIESPFECDDEQVTVNENLALYINDQKAFAPFEDATGELFVEFRVLILADEEEEKFMVSSIDEIQSVFGTIDQQNELAYGCYAALGGAAGRPVFALRTRGTDTEAYMKAVQKSQADPDMYAYVVLTDDQDCAAQVADYNVSLCAPDIKMWRRTFWGVQHEGEYTIARLDEKGEPLKATFTSWSGAVNSGNNNVVQVAEANIIDLHKINYNGLETTLYPGDFVEVLATGQRYKVKRVISSTEIELEEGPKAKVTTPQAISLIHADTPNNRREYVQQACTRFNSMRKTVVWSDHAMMDLEVIHNKFLACYVAGLASSVVPQQSLTRSEVTIVNNASRTYTQYTREELDEIARYGCLVIAQDTKNGPCYVRHNLTTETDKGILYYEESCIRNIDNMSLQTDEVLRGYIGKANVTASALRSMYAALTSLYSQLTTNSPSDLIGPQLISFEDLTIRQDPTLKSRVLVNVKWYVPAPLNNIRVYEMAFVADVTLSTVG